MGFIDFRALKIALKLDFCKLGMVCFLEKFEIN
jgi:hypothetical protein